MLNKKVAKKYATVWKPKFIEKFWTKITDFVAMITIER